MLERSRFVVGDAVWEKVAPLLPGKASDPGATARDNRLFLEAVLWRLSNDIGNPSRGDIENPSTPATVTPRPVPVRVSP